MSRTTQILAFSVPPAVVKEIETLAKEEQRTKSELFREMVRVFRRYRQQRDRDEERWVMQMIEEVKAEEKRQPTSQVELAKEEAELIAYGQREAKKLGIKPKDISRHIREHRQEEHERKQRS